MLPSTSSLHARHLPRAHTSEPALIVRQLDAMHPRHEPAISVLALADEGHQLHSALPANSVEDVLVGPSVGGCESVNDDKPDAIIGVICSAA